ncbi:S8 family peptidase [Flavobacteriales bacterium]|nr:S8 family peptidase [Flavobacteriales bacterium]
MRLIVLFLLLSAYFVSANEYYWVAFTDKNDSPFTVSNPSAFLSQRSIERRLRQNIEVIEQDLPVNPSYLNQINQLDSVSIRYSSKWLNSVSVSVPGGFDVSLIENLSFVDHVRRLAQYKKSPDPSCHNKNFELQEIQNLNYGAAYDQIALINGMYLHEQSYLGEDLIIAVMDGGFSHVDHLDGFSALRTSNRIVDVWNYVDGDQNVYQYSTHGTMVMSTMAGDIEGEYLGTAPGASYALYITEDVSHETLVEEDNWIVAAERADSLGADVCNTSLGYTEMDDPSESHVYNDLDGNTLNISIAADIAASKGMLMVNSAGNEGQSSWYYIGAPADGDSVLAIGACDVDGAIAPFSSRGPAADGDVKPNVTGPGWNVALFSENGVFYGSGTSFAGPITAGMATCLWQAFPDKSNMEIFHAIEESAHFYNTPNDDYGYGIPNFEQAFQLLQKEDVTDVTEENGLKVFFLDELTIAIENEDLRGETTIEVLSIDGKLIASHSLNMETNTIYTYELNHGNQLPSAIYLLRLYNEQTHIAKKFVKW